MQTIHITANSRLTATIKQQAIVAAQSTVIETPKVMTLAQWWQGWQSQAMLTAQLTVDLLPNKVLNGFEAQWLWEQALEQELKHREQNDTDSIAMLNVSATAKQLYQAWALSQEWLPNDWQDNHFLSAESQLFLDCQKRYLQKLNSKNWQDEVLLMQSRIHWLAELKIGADHLPQQFVLHGFDDLSPNIKNWMTALQALGCEVLNASAEIAIGKDFQLNHKNLTSFQHFAALDSHDEVEQVALWALNQLQQLLTSKPLEQVKIGVVAPNLADYKTALSQVLDEQILAQGLGELQTTASSNSKLYNFSLGEPLVSVAMIENAWQSLEYMLQPNKNLPYAEWSQWLTSAYTVGDFSRRHQADAQFRRLQWANIQWPNLLKVDAAQALPKPLLNALQKVQQNSQPAAQPSYLSLAEFTEQAWQTLEVIGWPGSRTLSSTEFQQKTAFENALNQFSALTEVAGKQSVGKWLTLLRRFLAEQVHQPQSVGAQPIQIVGMLEAGGQDFDALWIMGLSNEAWPRLSSPNPFLPNHLQRQYGLPRSDAGRELVYAQQISQRLIDSSHQVVWSYPQQTGEASLLPSLLMPACQQGAESYQQQQFNSLPATLYQQRHSDDFYWQLDAQGNEVEPGSLAPGGTGILQAQSLCPLMAYIDYRLGAKYGLQHVEDSLQNTNQGTLIHAVLENFWQQTQTQVALLALSDKEKIERLQQHIQSAFAELHGGLAEGVIQVEQQRILELCLQWLELESQRQSFAVTETEVEHRISLAGIEFKIIIDRIDQVDGQALVLDYKTGKASINALMQTPLAAPQLAVYLHAISDQVAGIGYALLHSDDGVKISAVVDDEQTLMKSRSIAVFAKLSEKEGGDYYQTTWQDFLDHLKQQVLELAEQIQQGQAPMTFNHINDIQYAEGYLALRVPEVMQQRQDAADLLQEVE